MGGETVRTTNSIRQALGHTLRKLITAGHTYIIDVRGPREIYHDRPNCFQVVAETMVYRNGELGPTLHLPFDPSVGVSEELLRFLEWPLRPFFDRYVWQGVPCFALRLGQDAATAERVMRLLLVDVYDYTTGTDVQCRVHDEGPLRTGDRPDTHAAPDRIPDEDGCPEP
jgi:hypothetical protein